MVMLDDRELAKVMSDETKKELQEIKRIPKEKEKVKQEVFFEDIYTFPIELNAKKDRVKQNDAI